MASSLEFVQYVCEQICDGEDISFKKMFGEYTIYCNGKVVGLVCDDQFFIKPTKAGKSLIGDVAMAPPYQGAKEYFLIEDLEDRIHLSAIIKATAEELPTPKPKKKKSGDTLGTIKKLTDMPNIGKVLAQQLETVGIGTPEELRKVGSKEAWSRILEIDQSACINRLCGLEGAIQNIRWHSLLPEKKTELKEYYKQEKNQ